MAKAREVLSLCLETLGDRSHISKLFIEFASLEEQAKEVLQKKKIDFEERRARGEDRGI